MLFESAAAQVDSAPTPPTPLLEAGKPDTLTIPPEFKTSLRLLLIDDERTLREGCLAVLQSEGYNVTVTGRCEEALDYVKRRTWDIVLCDLYLEPVSGTEILRAAMETNRDTIFIVMTGNPSVATNVEALRIGAWDYLPKPFTATHLQLLIGRAAHAILVARETQEMQLHPAKRAGNSDKMLLLGVSPAFRKAVELARRVASTDASVMITGESGTGKELIAQFIHRHSRRASRAMVPINCAALPETLLESEMFGHRKGSFTGADRDKPGLLETANGGTLFLDELTEMSQPIQAKLLRVVQDGVVRRVGSEQQDAVVDVRFISATNRDPHTAVAEGRLREDLLYRLRVVPIRLPALRERPEDVALLADTFLKHYWSRHHGAKAAPPYFSESALDFLRSCPWRGNVRELQNVIEHLAVVASPGRRIEPDDIPTDNSAPPPSGIEAFTNSIMGDAYHVAKDRLVGHFEREYLTRIVARAGSNMSKAARLANIDRTTLYRLMERHGFRRDDVRETLEVEVG
jgi:DNA-binding NtrC family response regulator